MNFFRFESTIAHQKDFMALQQGIQQAATDRAMDIMRDFAAPLNTKLDAAVKQQVNCVMHLWKTLFGISEPLFAQLVEEDFLPVQYVSLVGPSLSENRSCLSMLK